MNDSYILRLTNWSIAESATNPIITLDAQRNAFTVKVPERLRAKGKCRITVVSGEVTLEHYGGALEATRIVPTDARFLELDSNIPYLGHDVETIGSANCILIAGAIIGIDQKSVGTPDAGVGPLSFTCPELPPTITCKKWYLDIDNNRESADNYTTKTVPTEVVLQIEFFEDFYPPLLNKAYADRSRNDHNNLINT
jgi:hypothetical protein